MAGATEGFQEPFFKVAMRDLNLVLGPAVLGELSYRYSRLPLLEEPSRKLQMSL